MYSRNEIKPCPFCGRIPEMVRSGKNEFFIRCQCGIEQRVYSSKINAITAWNRRKYTDNSEREHIKRIALPEYRGAREVKE